jgi:hypothetical protein
LPKQLILIFEEGYQVDKRLSCYCGLYCENCTVKTKIHPAAKNLYDVMKGTGFDQAANNIPGGEAFWTFLKDIAESWVCVSCREGSGNPDCKVRICAQEKGVEMCALCGSYPCELMEIFDNEYPTLRDDNALLRDKGWEAWAEVQDSRLMEG